MTKTTKPTAAEEAAARAEAERYAERGKLKKPVLSSDGGSVTLPAPATTSKTAASGEKE